MRARSLGLLAAAPALCLALGGCPPDEPKKSTAAETEQAGQDLQYRQMLRNQPPPSYDWSPEREILTQIYNARMHRVTTWSYVISTYDRKIVWGCPSIGSPIPYSTQLTNPLQVEGQTSCGGNCGVAAVAIPQQEPNGLFTPSQSDATWVPCVNAKGKITPVYEENHVSSFYQEMMNNPDEKAGGIVPKPGGESSLQIDLGKGG